MAATTAAGLCIDSAAIHRTMPGMNNASDLAEQVAREARRLGGLGLMACTGGNLSVRCPDGRLLVTPSGVDKCVLLAAELLPCDHRGRSLELARKASDEGALHAALYVALPDITAVCHGHPPHAVALSMRVGTALEFAGIEMLKAFAGTTTHDCIRRLPVVDNYQDMAVLAEAVLARIDEHVPAVLVRGHGVYAWGRSVAAAGRHLEAVEWLCRVRLLAGQAGWAAAGT